MTRRLLVDMDASLFSELVFADRSLSWKSHRKVLWRCKHGHEWEATVASRANGAGCPYCSGRRRIAGVNDLATTDPGLAAQLVDQSLATELACTSQRKVLWRCEKGHEWEASPMSRSQGNGCPICSNHLVVPGINDLATTHPDLAAQCVDQDAVRKVSYGSTKRLRWRCEKGHEWDAVVGNRAIQNQGCPYCAGAALSDSGASHVSKRLSKSLTWTCPVCGDTFSHDVASYVSGRRRCPTCVERERAAKSLAVLRPDLVMELVNKSDASLGAQSNKKVMWKCALGHTWSTTPAIRFSGSGCPYCAGRKVLPGFNDLATVRPDLACHTVDPDMAKTVTIGSHKSIRWRCDNGHEFDATVKDVVRGRWCPVCAGKFVVPGINDLATTHPLIARELVSPDVAKTVVAGSSKIVRWRCEQGHEWDASVKERAIRGQGCPYCSNRRVMVGFNDLATTHPSLASELVDFSVAKSVVAGSNRAVEWCCDRGHRWHADIYSRAYLGYGCPVCGHGRHESIPERELAEAVSSMLGNGVEVLRNTRSILPSGRELDIYVPSRRFAIEFNGCWWHSEEAGKGRSYHMSKFEECASLGIRLVTVWEDTWAHRRKQVLSMLETKLGVSHERRVFARKLFVRDVSGHDARVFHEAHHIQGFVAATRHLGLWDAGELVAVLSVRSPRSSGRNLRKQGEWEIVRYSTSCLVVGGFSRLLSHMEQELVSDGIDIRRWVTFSDCEVSDGNLYAKCGFLMSGAVAPDYRYVGSVTGGVRRPKESFQKTKFRDNSRLLYEEGLTERELATLNGLYRCWDSGKRRWIKDVQHV